ncbi:pectinesterase family protein [Treponema zioleckii]|uniref:pectinesterase family protein n=1 Tax=Treponema zioleckii TaxID=331680 RepID=UPI00168B3D64|nr:pectinesterase family protein [Treponema zioleckii]
MEKKLTSNDSLAEFIASLANDDSLKNNPLEEIKVILAPGEHKGLFHERIFYDLPNPLAIQGENPKNTALRSENCEAYHKDTENRAVFTFGKNCTKVTLRDFTIENTHVKTCDDASLGNQAEAICWHNDKGFLYCENMHFLSRQDTIHVRGFSHFKNCYVAGDVDFIWGYCDTSIFDGCHIHTIKDNRGDGHPAYVLQSRALNSRPGFIFIGCDFTADDRGKGARIFIGRSQGTGKKDSVDRWDSIALVNCTVSPEYDEALWTDENGTRAVYPEKGCALTGWREFGTKIRGADSNLVPYDSKKQEKHGYTMSLSDLQQLQKSVESTNVGTMPN